MLQGIATQQIGVCLQQFAKIKALTLAPVMRGNILGKRAIVGQRGVLIPAEKSRAGDGLDASAGEIADFSCAARCYT